MTEKDFENELEMLIKSANEYDVTFRVMLSRDGDNTCDGTITKSNASEHKDTVYLTLVKADDFADWVTAFNEAQKLIGDIINRKSWEQTNPNLFERLQFKYGNPNKCR